ncbi:TniQ family protein [Rhizobium leguminosarum]|uniref:TniQ family protein n=1 Tax=Rhizobium leguminosarum TaxID=384 RepID=UPI0014429170|nr:TniQ family protein [Rhizobium leguminosarum]
MPDLADPSSFYSPPTRGEAADGYVLRRIGEEYHRSTTIFLNMVTTDHRGSFLDRAVRLLRDTAMPDEDRSMIDQWTPRNSREYLVVNEQRLRSYNFNKSFRRICPGCVEEAQFHRVWWDIVYFRVCPIHRISLVEKNALGKRYVWSWPFVGVDRYGLECGASMPWNPDEDAFEYYLLERLGVVNASTFRPLLEGLSLDQVIDHCAFLGRLLSNPFSRKTPAERSSDCQVGFAALRDNKDELERSIEAWLLAETTQALRNKGLEKAFGWARVGARTTWLRNVRLLNTAIKVVLARTGRLGRGSLQHNEGILHREITLTELAERHRLHKKGMRAVLDAIGIPVSEKGSISFFDESKVAEVDKFMGGLLTDKEAADLLGCKRWVLGGLIRHGRLRGFSRIARRLAVVLYIPREDVEKLLAAFNSLPVSGESHAVYTLRTFCNKEGITGYDVVERLFKGTLQIAAIDPTRHGMDSWRFYMRDMAKPARRLPRWKKPLQECMTHTEACTLTSINPLTISHLAKVGVFDVSPDNATWLMRTSVEDFHRQYAKAWLHRDELNFRSRAGMQHTLERLGMTVYFRGDNPRCELIISRTELADAVGETATPSPAAETVWQEFKAGYEDGYSAFHMPLKIETKPQRLALASRRTFFEVFAHEDAVIIRKTFSRNRPREWRAFDAERMSFFKALQGFELVEEEGEYVAELYVRNGRDIKVAWAAIDAIHWNIRKVLGPRRRA